MIKIISEMLLWMSGAKVWGFILDGLFGSKKK
jgi:hypothetical protein